jgi:hypothetical protein
VHEDALLYEETEATESRFVGFLGTTERLDFVITSTSHFYGKKLVTCLQSRRCAILDAAEAEDVDLIKQQFDLDDEESAASLATFLSSQLSS